MCEKKFTDHLNDIFSIVEQLKGDITTFTTKGDRNWLYVIIGYFGTTTY